MDNEAVERARGSLRRAIDALDALGMTIAAAHADLALSQLDERYPSDGRSAAATQTRDWPTEQ